MGVKQFSRPHVPNVLFWGVTIRIIKLRVDSANGEERNSLRREDSNKIDFSLLMCISCLLVKTERLKTTRSGWR